MLENFRNIDMDERNDDIEDEATISETIEVGKEIEATHYKTSILTVVDDIQYATSNIIEDYLDELINVSIAYDMTDEELNKYYMRPDLFCYDMYGNINLDFIILMINGINDDKDFIDRTILYIDPEYMDEILSYIIDSEEETIRLNREALGISTDE